MTYDSLGRMVLNVEPNTSIGFTPLPTTNLSGLSAWRYAYDDAGNLVGTSDARGCGANYTYDAGGRITGEDYSPCTEDQASYTAAGGMGGFEVLYAYDDPDDDTQNPGIAGFPVEPSWLTGRLVSARRTALSWQSRDRRTTRADARWESLAGS